MEYVIFASGIWLSGTVNGETRASAWVLGASNLIARKGGRRVGVFSLSQENLDEAGPPEWPTDLGAPSDANGNPQLLGDGMLWTALLQNPDVLPTFHPEELLSAPLRDVVVSETVAEFSRDDFQDLVLIRFNILNRGSDEITNLHFGYYADIDLNNSGCISATENSVGFDSSSVISYTYPGESRGDAKLACSVPAVGYSILCPHCRQSGAKFYHPILGKNADLDAWEFGEISLESPLSIHYRLQGLSGSGAPMVDPTSGEPTPYGFTGDPIAETGWLGIKSDVRSVLSVGGLTLPAGQSLPFTVVFAAVEGERLSQTITQLRATLAESALKELPTAR